MADTRESTGIPALDRLLAGGIERKVITQIVGEPASGKTSLCLIAAVACLRSGRAVVWIDSEGFSVERFRQVAGEEAETLADRLFLYEPTDFARQGTMILEADKTIRSRNVGLIVVDSATALYRTELEHGKDAMQALTRQMLVLLGFARRYDIPVLITNQVYRDPAKNMYFGLGGTALEHISKAIVMLERRINLGERKATLMKHRSIPPGGSFTFIMTGDGISA
ncbi:MAG TPA: DNA repair and recombination protein RadB [Methanoregulaceae archaeon]|nr:DNA repair and recombination protein RadB [Methanoregulaceae archaeon]HPD75073.1 DNA repair and recombination protein RadB [Methanoregulaceae archaeon]HRY75385.1 DNA repair and recombination protein RadB [Methanoregulaceae archaeon]